MRFLAFMDVHDDKKCLQELLARARQEDIAFVVCAGDLTQLGRGIDSSLQAFSKLGKKFYMIPGNHESPEVMRRTAAHPSCIDFDRKAVRLGDYVFLGYGGGGFSMEDAAFRKIAREWYGKYKEEKIVLVTHGPPFGTKIDLLEKRHVGNRDFRSFIERLQPKLVICGHLHETAGTVDKIGKVQVINPGWDGMVIDLK